MTPRRICDWCHGPLPDGCRSDTITCSKRCRQGRNRFIRGVGPAPFAPAGVPRRLAYADPPYPGLSARYYSTHPDFAGEVDHAALIRRLSAGFDAWALSTSAAALVDVLPLCPAGSRVAVWVRGERPNPQATVPLNAWEPVIYGGRIGRWDDAPPPLEARRRDAAAVVQDLGDVSLLDTARRVDALVYGARPRTTDPDRIIGTKPAVFCGWLFRLLGAAAGDEFTDLFPGSGGVARAWHIYSSAPAGTAAS